MNDEFDRTWKEADMICVKVLSRHSAGGLRKTTKTFSLDTRCPGRDPNQAPSEYKLGTSPPD
jgi:hypothetical protein